MLGAASAERAVPPLAPPGTPVRDPAFDMTPAALVSALVTERGVVRGPSVDAIATLLGPAMRVSPFGRASARVRMEADRRSRAGRRRGRVRRHRVRRVRLGCNDWYVAKKAPACW